MMAGKLKMTDLKSHWDKVYSAKRSSELSWHLPHLRLSLELIRRAGVSTQQSIIDVGGGESTLVDDLLNLGYQNVTVLDISARAIEISRQRLHERASSVNWVTENILKALIPEHRYRLWHDRAVFHFLTEEEDRRAYAQQVRLALSPGGFLVIATFSLNGPSKCSGLEVHRYSTETLLGELGPGFRLLDAVPENHKTPSGKTQEFLYCLFTLDE